MIKKWIKLHSIIKSKPGKATQNLIPVRLEKVKVKMLLKKELDGRISYAVQRCYKELEFGQLMEASVCGRGVFFQDQMDGSDIPTEIYTTVLASMD